ncbi:MAG: DUF1294 domain-containing protein [Candidatus Bathyarchaeota archaeon]|nr:DUF1294 domain-containing protein [Candidatus Bathyarchaeota archaeon]
MNFVSLVCFGLDKLWAIRGGARIPESRLLSLAFLGPFGALMGMLLFRHKTRKPRFLLVPLFVLFQIALVLSFHLI